MSADQRVNQKLAPWHLVVILRRHRNLILSTIVSLQGPLTGPLLRPTSHTGTNARPRYFLERKLRHDFLASVASSWVGNCLGFSSLVEMGILPSLDDKPQGNGGAPATTTLSGRQHVEHTVFIWIPLTDKIPEEISLNRRKFYFSSCFQKFQSLVIWLCYCRPMKR